MRRGLLLPPLGLLALIWGVAFTLWGFALVDLGGGMLGELQQQIRAYCFGWDPSGRSPMLARTSVMAAVPTVFTGIVLYFWRLELFGTRTGRRGLCLTLGTVVLLGSALFALIRQQPIRNATTLATPSARPVCSALVLTDQEGRAFDLHQARGKVVALTFFYTQCMHTCPAQMDKLLAVQAALHDRLGADLLLVGVSIDAVRDDAAALRAYAMRRGCTPDGWRLLSGARADVESVLNRYGIAYGMPTEITPTSQIGHSALIVLVDRAGRRAQDFPGTEYADEELIEGVRRLLDEAPPGTE